MDATIQVGNWRTPEVQLLEANDVPIDLTGATGVFVWNDPDGTAYEENLVIGRAPENSTNPVTEGQNGWCHATLTEIDIDGQWAEQVQATLPGDAEPLNARVVTFEVEPNLARPTP